MKIENIIKNAYWYNRIEIRKHGICNFVDVIYISF
jgi:hypothetical protein